MDIIEKILNLPPWITIDGLEYEFRLWSEGSVEVRFCYTIYTPGAEDDLVATGRPTFHFLYIVQTDEDLHKKLDKLRTDLINAGHADKVAFSEKYRAARMERLKQ